MALRLGVLGGTFNPIHSGHLAAAEEVRSRLQLERILFIPSSIPPHKQDEEIPSALHRMEMVRLATAGNPGFELSDVEIRRGGKSYTVDTIEMLLQIYRGSDLFFITGLDSFLEIRTWNRWDTLLSLCRFIVLSRPGYRFADLEKIDFMQNALPELSCLDSGELAQAVIRTGSLTVYCEKIPLYDISSTDIRRRVKEGKSIKYLLPEAVETYIIEKRLYV